MYNNKQHSRLSIEIIAGHCAHKDHFCDIYWRTEEAQHEVPNYVIRISSNNKLVPIPTARGR